MKVPYFGNLAAYSGANNPETAFWGIWQAVVASVNENGTYDCVIMRNNTTLVELDQVNPPQIIVSGPLTIVSGPLIISGEVLFEGDSSPTTITSGTVYLTGTVQVSGKLDSLMTYEQGDNVMVGFRDGRRDWPILLGGVHV